MNAVIYARYSSDNQRTESIDAQISAIQKYANNNNIKILDTYIDEAKSARTDNRPSFLKMIEDSNKGIFNCIIVHKLDRFSRDRYDSIYYKRKLKNNNVKLVSVTENIDGSPESIMLEGLIEAMGEYYSKNLAREVMKGMLENAKQGKHNGGLPPLGYDVDDNRNYIINETESTAVKKIFTMYLKGYTYKNISDWLYENDYKTKRNKNFDSTSLKKILKNNKYMGVYTFNKNDKENKIMVENALPIIIDEKTFDEVQLKMTNTTKKRTRNNTTHKYLLSGVLVCGHCGSNMVGRSSKTKAGKVNVRYGCSERKKNKDNCSKKDINRDNIEKLVLDTLENEIFNKKVIDTLANKICTLYNEKINMLDDSITVLKDKLKDTKSQIDNIINAVATTGILSSNMKTKLEDLEELESNLTVKIQNETHNKNNKMTKEKIIKTLNLGKDLSIKEFDEKKAIINSLIDKIVITEVDGTLENDDITITLNSDTSTKENGLP